MFTVKSVKAIAHKLNQATEQINKIAIQQTCRSLTNESGSAILQINSSSKLVRPKQSEGGSAKLNYFCKNILYANSILPR